MRRHTVSPLISLLVSSRHTSSLGVTVTLYRLDTIGTIDTVDTVRESSHRGRYSCIYHSGYSRYSDLSFSAGKA